MCELVAQQLGRLLDQVDAILVHCAVHLQDSSFERDVMGPAGSSILLIFPVLSDAGCSILFYLFPFGGAHEAW